jgi:hypothetical protein
MLRVGLNTIGVCLSFLLFYNHSRLFLSIFPINKAPWAGPMNKIHYIEKIILLFNICIIVFEDYILERISLYVLLIPYTLLTII